MKKFISCDWGTSAFRIRLIDSDHLEVIAEISTNDGIAETYSRWTNTNRPAEERLMFYMSYLQDKLLELKKETGSLLPDVPVIISGMASSTIGMIELPYKELPFNTDGSDLTIETFSDGKLIIVSGACTEKDVLRGEETMLVGCTVGKDKGKQLMIFPGTHSKHIYVENGKAVDFKTYMTGEFFDLLSNKSILANSVSRPREGKDDLSAFDEGVQSGSKGNLLNDVFSIRSNQVLRKTTPDKNYSFLSGLLIGHELKEVNKADVSSIQLVCGSKLKRQYLRALQLLVPPDKYEFRDADHALIRGHLIVCEHFAA